MKLQELASPSAEKKYSLRTIESLKLLDEEKINKNLICVLVEQIHRSEVDGAILIFVPGFAEIRDLIQVLQDSPVVGRSKNVVLLPLHSSLSSADQVHVVLG